MPDLLPLVLSEPRIAVRRAQPPVVPKVEGPGAARQGVRLQPAISRVESTFSRLRPSGDPEALDVEQILVLTVAGPLQKFADALAHFPGLESLGHQVTEVLKDEDFRAVDRDGAQKTVKRELYLIASDWAAWKQLLTHWEHFLAGNSAKRGFTPIRRLFEHLVDLRVWSDLDRLKRAGAADEWRRTMASHGNAQVAFEVEFWFRTDPVRRAFAERRFQESLATYGTLGQTCVLPEIRYHGAVGYAPAASLLEAAEKSEIDWLSTEGVRSFRAAGQVAAPSPESEPAIRGRFAPRSQDPGRTARISMLDGVPQLGHEALAGLVRFDDPDDRARAVPARQRRHGTAMASLILHGELSPNSQPEQPEAIYARPILVPSEWDPALEAVPSGELPVPLIHEAVARMFEGDDPAAPETKVIVLAFGDPNQRFHRFVSPLARLLDWLAWKYKVLFLVSTGNHTDDIEVGADLDLKDGVAVHEDCLESLVRNALSRRLFSPAEATNVLTVGAAHSDNSGVLTPEGLVEPFYDPSVPSVLGTVASGIGRSIKPDVLMPGGRQLLRPELIEDGAERRRLSLVLGDGPPGVEVASPGADDGYVRWSGTSMATGLAGHAAIDILRQIDAFRSEHGTDPADPKLDALLVRAGIVHTASWGSGESAAVAALEAAGQSTRRDQIGRVLGYGRADPRRAFRANSNRAMLVRTGLIEQDALHEFWLPLPPALDTVVVRRRLSVTLAWFSPVRPGAQSAYRTAVLEFAMRAGKDDPFGPRRDADHRAAGRGTVIHETFESSKAVLFEESRRERLEVTCRATGGDTLSEPVPYALLVSVETPDNLDLPIYQQIKDAVPVPVPTPVQVPIRPR